MPSVQTSEYRPKSDVTERGVWSGSTLFAYRNFYLKQNENEKNTTDTPKFGNGISLLISMEKPSELKRVSFCEQNYMYWENKRPLFY